MNSRKLTKYVILIFTILLADIIKEIILHYIGFHKNFRHPYTSVAMGMGIIVLVFYPLFLLMETIMEKIAESYIQNTKKIVGSNLKGLIIALFVGLGALYFVYLKVWFNVNIFKVLF
jgi:hypothetical protein